MMKLWPLVLGLVGGCITPSGGPTGDGGGYSNGWGSGYGGSGGSTGYGCHADSDCGGLVCARTGACLSATEVRVIHVSWTVNAEVASAATCVKAPDLELTFGANTDGPFGFAPVPCVEGKFTVDKMPIAYKTVQLEREYDYAGGTSGTFDSTGSALLDLAY
ncbi:hypothetical protein BH11MYX1_BH11MYX1_37380 [soil metagenome]